MVTVPAFAVPMLIGAAPEALPMLMAEALPLSMAKVPLVGPVTVVPRTESGPPVVVVVAERPMLTASAFAVPMLIGEALPLSMANVPEVGPVTVAPSIDDALPIWVVGVVRPMVTVPAFAVPMLIGAAPEALPMLMAEALPLSMAKAPVVGPVIFPSSLTENFEAPFAWRSIKLPV